jgi:hypothetical protein
MAETGKCQTVHDSVNGSRLSTLMSNVLLANLPQSHQGATEMKQ